MVAQDNYHHALHKRQLDIQNQLRLEMNMPLIHDDSDREYQKPADLYSANEKEREYYQKVQATIGDTRAVTGRALGGPVESERTQIERLTRENATLRMRVTAVIELHLRIQSQFQSLRHSERNVTADENEMQRLVDQFQKMTADFVS